MGVGIQRYQGGTHHVGGATGVLRRNLKWFTCMELSWVVADITGGSQRGGGPDAQGNGCLGKSEV